VRIVVDANVIVQACIEQNGLGRLRNHELTAPPIMASETVSTLRELAFRGELTAELAKVAMDRFQAMQFETLAPERLWSTAWNVAESLGSAKTYDAEYVALAQITDCALVTLDARLARGAARVVRVLGVAELPVS